VKTNNTKLGLQPLLMLYDHLVTVSYTV